MKIPFFNKQNYILVKAYTFDRRIAEDAALTIGSKTDIKPACPVDRDSSIFLNTLGHCYGNVASLKRSITIPSWSEFRVVGEENNVMYQFPQGNISRYHYINHEEFNMPSTMCMTKLLAPWALKCNKKDINFVLCRHMLNNTPMVIPTGVMPIRYNCSPHIFNAICKGVSFKVKYRLPLVSLYPLSDLPLHIEVYEDIQEYESLARAFDQSKPYFEKTSIKESLQK